MDIWLTIHEVRNLEKISDRAVRKRIQQGKYPKIRQTKSERGGGRGGLEYQIHFSSLSTQAQQAYIRQMENISPEIILALPPEVAIEAARKMLPVDEFDASSQKSASVDEDQGGSPFAISEDVLRDERVGQVSRIVQEAINVPAGQKRRQWAETVALKYDVHPATLYRYIKRYQKAGLAGLKHHKITRGRARSWSPEAIDFWIGLVLKREHRKVSKESLYKVLTLEAERRGWQVGSYRSALWWLKRKITPQLIAIQHGGKRALDNILPPICRDYSDLLPFEILVGDQHRFDFWVMDDITGEVFRPEGYFWQDLRTRCLYGGAVATKYDAHLMGLALRMGLRVFGPFQNIYTDHGKPEESRYVMGILKEMRALGLSALQTTEMPADLHDADPETTTCMISLPGTHRKAIVRNAKAKMIEGTFSALEGILRNQLKLPGNVKRLAAAREEQDIDHQEAERLALAGKLPTFQEFILSVLQAMDHYNARKPHRGVLREWRWKPRPKQATPMQCLAACYLAQEWQPVRMSESVLNLIFLPRVSRTVDRGRIRFQKRLYEDEALITLSGQRVDIRHDPLDPEWILVFHGGAFICQAEPLEYSSMKDRDLADRKIAEKARRRKQFLEEYRRLTSRIPDFREYSRAPAAERTAALVGKAKRRRAQQRAELYRVRSPEELAAEIAKIENYRPPRPVFTSEVDRYRWILDQMAASAEIDQADRDFVAAYESHMNQDTKTYWGIYKESIGLLQSAGETNEQGGEG